MDNNLYKNLLKEGLISEESYDKILKKNSAPLFSLHWELRSVLYLGVILLTTGLGLLIYKNIDTIGHEFILVFIALTSTSCFAYCFKNKLPFSPSKVPSPNSFFDYILLLASLSFIIMVGYLQTQYHVFGNNYSIATLIPTLGLFFTAYYFDHLGILNMAIASLAVWLGVSVTPRELLLHTNFDSQTIIYTYFFLGILLMAAAFITMRFGFKNHFKFSYQHYGVHLAFIAMLAGYFHYESSVGALWLLGVAGLSVLVYFDSIKNRSFYFLLLALLYGYIALSSLVIRALIKMPDAGGIYLLLIYFITSALVLVFLLIRLNRKLKTA